MRKLLKYIPLVCLIIALPVMAQAADKIGVVNSELVLQNSAAGKKAMADLKSKAESKQRDIQRQNDELKRLGDDYQKKSVTLSADAKAKAQAELEVKARKMMEDQQSYSQQMDQEQKRVMEPLFKTFEKVIDDYAKKNGFSIIIERRAVHYVASSIDVTADVTKAFEAAAR